MNTLTLIGVVLCFVVVSGRHYEDRNEHERLSDIEDQKEEFTKHRDHLEPTRHRRRRWQMGYGYDYPPPQHGYYPERRDYDRNQQDIAKIIRLLEEIATYVRRPQPPPPPQPIYIPYPVPYRIANYSPCNNTKNPAIFTRFPEMEDSNQNWGFVPQKEEDEDYDYGSRPLSFEPIKPKRPMSRPMPKVEHGSTQAQASTAAPVLVDTTAIQCKTAILACCADKDRLQCFTNFGCSNFYDDQSTCSTTSIADALQSIKVAYAPSQ